MENNINSSTRKRKRGRRKRNPPPIFNNDYPGPFSGDPMPCPVPELSGGPSTPFPFPLDPREILTRFNQLLDWRLPQNIPLPTYNNHGRNDGLNVFEERNYSSSSVPREDLSKQSSGVLNKRKIIDANDLRIRLDQQSKRWKNSHEGNSRWPLINDNYNNEGGFAQDDRPNPTFDNRRDIDDRNNDRNCSYYQREGVRDLEDRWADIPNDCARDGWLDGPNDGSRDRWPDGANNHFRDHLSDGPNNGSRDHWSDVPRDRCPDGPSSYSRDRWPDGPSNYSRNLWSDGPSSYSRDRWPDGPNSYSRDRWPDDNRDLIREIKECWSERKVEQLPEKIYSRNEGFQRRRSSEMDPFEGNRSDYDGRAEPIKSYSDGLFQKRDRDDRYDRENMEFQRRERDYISGHYNNRGTRPYVRSDIDKDDRYLENYMSAGPSHLRSISPRRDIERSRIDSMEFSSSRDTDEDLMVLIHKPKFAKFTYQEADALRASLVDLVVKCDNPPEFLNSGLMRGGKGFHVQCRTKETLNWLLKQNLPPLNGVELSIRTNKVYETVKISAFAPRCTRSKDELMKLIKLQNCKKGFNFDEWSLRSYNTTPNGIYIAYDISLNEAQTLRNYNCQLSFELKTLIFKIAFNSLQTSIDLRS